MKKLLEATMKRFGGVWVIAGFTAFAWMYWVTDGELVGALSNASFANWSF